MNRSAQRLGIALAIVLLTATTSCESVGRMLENAPKPTASIKGVSFDGFDMQSLSLRFDVEVQNPYSLDLPVAKMDLGLSSRQQQFLAAHSTEQGTVPAKAARVFPVLAKIEFATLLSTVAGIKPGAVVPYRADFGIGVDAPGVGRIDLPLRKEGEIPVPAVPDVSVQGIHWQNLSLQEAAATLKLEIGNTNDFPIDLSQLAYTLALADVKVAETSLRNATKFAPGQKQIIEIPFALKPTDLGLAAFNMLRGSGAGYRFDGRLAGDTPFGPLSMPVSKTGRTTFTR